MQFLYLGLYLLLAAVVVILSIKLSNYVDLLDKKTKLSGALLGGILLAAVTSLPELFTSLTGTLIVKENQYVLGNIVGSNFFDLVIFSVVYFLFFKKIIERKPGKQHYYSMAFILGMTILLFVAAFVFTNNNWLIGGIFNPISILILLVYVIYVWKTPKTEDKEEKEEIQSKLTVKQIWTYFIICSIVLIGASIAVTYVTDLVISSFNIGKTFGGSLFLGVATSLPEVTATIALCKKKNFNAAFGDIFGSCVFNTIILSIADIFSFVPNQPLYFIDQTSFLLLVGLTYALIMSFLSILFIRSKKFKDNTSSRIILYVFGFLLLSSYIVYLVLTNINLSIPFAPFLIQ